jgi:glycosyltransferase involved in cell wall biosynthesis
LLALDRQTRRPDEVHVIVRDDDPETSKVVREIAAQLPGLREIGIERAGVIAAINRGLDRVTGDVVILTDDDAEAFPGWIEGIEHRYQAEPQIGAVGGRDWIQSEGSPLSDPAPTTDIGQLGPFGRMSGNHHCPCPTRPLDVAVLKGVNLSFRREAIGDLRIDEGLHGSGAQVGWEVDLCLSLKNRGWRLVFDDNLVVKHHVAPRHGGDDRMDFAGAVGRDIVYNSFYLMGKHGSPYQVAGFMFSRIVVGSRWTPGVMAMGKWCLKGDWSVFRRCGNQFGSILTGTLAGISQRHP